MLVAQKPQGPTWLSVMGANFLFEPITRQMVLRARRASREASQGDDAGGMTALQMLDEMGDALSEALIIDGMKDWREVAQQRFDDDGEPILDKDGKPVFDPLPFSPENVAMLLSDAPTFDAIDTAYVVPFITRERQRAEPGNGSAASPNGTGEAAMPDSGTATSVASRKRTGGAADARTSTTKRKPRPKKTSGTR